MWCPFVAAPSRRWLSADLRGRSRRRRGVRLIGSSVTFEERGVHSFENAPGTLRVYAVTGT
jgi:hypothetical protein